MLSEPRLVNGRYEVNGKRLPRVSDILAILANPGLDAWRRRVGFAEADRVSREATAWGTAIHRVCELVNRLAYPFIEHDDLAEPDVIWFNEHPEVWPFAEIYRRWFVEQVAEVLAAERTVVHTRHGYAGTLDLYARMRDGRRMVWDIKSSNSISPDYRLQLTAYAAALEEAGEQVDGRGVVNLPSREPGTLRAIEFDDDERDRKAWIALVRLYRWQERHQDDWKRGRR